jgi:hypothetical protein
MLRSFLLFLRWSLEACYASPFFFGTILLTLNLLASLILQRPLQSPVWKKQYSLVIMQFLFFPATLAAAAAGQPSAFSSPNYWALRALDAFLIGSVAVGGYFVFRMKEMRWFAASVVLLQLWILASASFIAGMALTNDWL